VRPTTALRRMLAEPGCTISVSAHDPLLARLVEQAGFKVVGLSGNAIAAAYLGMPDMGFLNLGDMVNVARNRRRCTYPGVGRCRYRIR
jgi:2-methylisocitrate lyase-like PEP mutase family enzyme